MNGEPMNATTAPRGHTTSRLKRGLIAPALLVLALLASACGSDDEADTSQPESPATTAAPATPSDDGAAAEPAAAPDSEATETEEASSDTQATETEEASGDTQATEASEEQPAATPKPPRQARSRSAAK